MRPLKRTCPSLQELKNRTRRKTTGTPKRTEVRQTEPANVPTTSCTLLFTDSVLKKQSHYLPVTLQSWRPLWVWTLQTKRKPGWSSRSSWHVGQPIRQSETKDTSKVITQNTAPFLIISHMCICVAVWMIAMCFCCFTDQVFGCSLTSLCQRENTSVPNFVKMCIDHVENTGMNSSHLNVSQIPNMSLSNELIKTLSPFLTSWQFVGRCYLWLTFVHFLYC